MVEHPVEWHYDGEMRYETGMALLVSQGHCCRDPRHTVKPEGPFWTIDFGEDVRRPWLRIASPKAPEQVLECLMVVID